MTTRTCAWIAAALVLAGSACHAQPLYKCVAGGAPVSYQTEPCARGARTEAIRDYRPDPPPSAERLQELEARRRQAEQDSAFLSRRAGTDRTVKLPRTSGARRSAGTGSAVDACAEARRRRDAWEEATGLRRTYEDLRAWNERVSRACR